MNKLINKKKEKLALQAWLHQGLTEEVSQLRLPNDLESN